MQQHYSGWLPLSCTHIAHKSVVPWLVQKYHICATCFREPVVVIDGQKRRFCQKVRAISNGSNPGFLQ